MLISKIVDAAKEFSFDMIGSFDGGLLWKHTLLVQKISKRLAKQTKGCNKEALSVACYLHDLGIPKHKDTHAEFGVEIAKTFFKTSHQVSESFKQIVFDAILNHGSGKHPKTKEGLILSSADKMSFFDDANIVAISYKLSKIEDSLQKMAEKMIAKFEKKYAAIPLELGKQIVVKKYKEVKGLFSSFL